MEDEHTLCMGSLALGTLAQGHPGNAMLVLELGGSKPYSMLVPVGSAAREMQEVRKSTKCDKH